MVQFARSKATATSAAWLSKSSNSFRSRNASPSMANPLLTSSVFYQPTKGGQFTTETPDSPIDLFRPPTPRAKADVHPGFLGRSFAALRGRRLGLELAMALP